jgi:hypothetical protein
VLCSSWWQLGTCEGPVDLQGLRLLRTLKPLCSYAVKMLLLALQQQQLLLLPQLHSVRQELLLLRPLQRHPIWLLQLVLLLLLLLLLQLPAVKLQLLLPHLQPVKQELLLLLQPLQRHPVWLVLLVLVLLLLLAHPKHGVERELQLLQCRGARQLCVLLWARPRTAHHRPQGHQPRVCKQGLRPR